MDTLALTDTNGMYGLLVFLQSSREEGVRPIIGVEVTTDTERAVLLVKDREGYSNLCRIVTQRHGDFFVLSDSLLVANSGLVVLSDCRPLLQKLRGSVDLYAELMAGRQYRPLLDWARSWRIPPVATAGAFFPDNRDHRFHCLLRAIDCNTRLSRIPPEEIAPPAAWLMDPETLAGRFPHVPEALANTAIIADRCRFQGDFGKVVCPGFEGLDQEAVMSLLREKSIQGATKRYGGLTPAVRKRLDHELEVIEAKGFGSVFLIMDEIVRQAPRTCGRGSAAASIVSYCLGITHVDPLKHDLYFERFLNPGRKDPPDIDVDFPWDERDGILEFVLTKYGPHRAAMVANHVGFRPRAAVREIAKVLGLPDAEIKQVTDRLSHLWYWTGQTVEDVVSSHPIFRGLRLESPWPEILNWASRLLGMPRHLSVHCGGVVVVPDCLDRYVPSETAPKGVRIVQWEKDQTEDAGLVKIDLLGNRSLAVIRDALEAIRQNTGRIIHYESFNPLEDPDTQALIARGDTLGVFYIESPAMRQLQKKTGKGDFGHVVIHSSIIRPAANRFISEYVRRLKGGSYESVHPVLERVLAETHGIMVYQEDVTKIAVEMAGFSPEDGDGLRKTLSKKRNHKRLAEYQEQFELSALARGATREAIGAVWDMILSFGGYSFCKPHSASYALVSFKSAYLRVHYPAEFMAAVISNGGGYYSPFAYISESRRMGLAVLPPDINASGFAYTGREREIRIGLMQLRGMKKAVLDRIVDVRQEGPFTSFENLLRRALPPPEDLRILIKSGCLDSIAGGRSRAELLWEAEIQAKRKTGPQAALPLFEEEAVELPALGDYDFRTMLLHEVEILGFPLSVHPLDLYVHCLEGRVVVRACDLARYVGKRISMAGWWVTNKMVMTRKDEPMAFISFEDQTALYETVFFPDAYSRYASRFTPLRPYLLRGVVDDDQGALSLHVEEMSYLSGGGVIQDKRKSIQEIR